MFFTNTIVTHFFVYFNAIVTKNAAILTICSGLEKEASPRGSCIMDFGAAYPFRASFSPKNPSLAPERASSVLPSAPLGARGAFGRYTLALCLTNVYVFVFVFVFVFIFVFVFVFVYSQWGAISRAISVAIGVAISHAIGGAVSKALARPSFFCVNFVLQGCAFRDRSRAGQQLTFPLFYLGFLLFSEKI